MHPEILAAIAAANDGHQVAYGEDVYTERLQQVFAQHFGEGVEAFPVFNGTGANVTALQSMLPRWGAVISAKTAHINSDEGGAPERVGGIKLLTVDAPDGKLTPELIDQEAWGWGDEHRAQPLVVSITQTTELGTAYTADEIRAIADHAHAHGMKLHIDGARLGNAAASLGLPLRAFTRDAGVDLLSVGGTKNGCLGAEAIVVLNPEASEGLKYLRKLNMQLASKMRFVSAQLIALLRGRPVAAQRRARERDGRAPARRARRRHRGGRTARPRLLAADAVERRLRGAARRASPTGCATAVPLLRLGRRQGRGALDVLVRHDRGRHRRVRRRHPRGARRGVVHVDARGALHSCGCRAPRVMPAQLGATRLSIGIAAPRMRSAARWPERSAPLTVAGPSPHVASPARCSTPPIGVAMTS